MNCAFFVAAALATTPITVQEVRLRSRENTPALLAQLDLERAREQTRLVASAMYPHLQLNGSAGGSVAGPSRELNPVPEYALTPDGQRSSTIIGFTPQYGDINASRAQASFDLSVTASQLIYDGGKWWSQIAQAGALEEAQAGQLAEQQLASEYEGVRRFFELLRVQESLQVLQQNAQRSQEQLERARSLFDAGRGQLVDVLGAQVNLGNDQLAVVRQSASIANAQAQLAAWVMRPGTEALEAKVPDTFHAPPPPAPSVEEAIATARQSRPLLKAVSQRLRAAESAIGAAQGGHWPSIAAQITGGRRGPSVDPFFTDPTRQNYVQGGLSLRWDLFTGYQASAQIQQAEIDRRRAQLEMAQAERELEAEIRTAVATLAAQLEASQISRANMEASRKALEVAQARFTAGAGSTIEVRDAQLKLAQAELNWVHNRIDIEIARAALERSMGKGATP